MDKRTVLKNVAEKFKSSGNLDVVKFAQELGIDVYYKKDIVSVLRSFSRDFNAKINYNKKKQKFEIFVNPFHPITRQRFSVAHEIAHFILHQDLIRERKNGISRNGKNSKAQDDDQKVESEMEKQADNLAAEILMPEEILNKFLQENGYQKDKALEEADVKKIAENFKVSPLVAIIRLRNLGYVVPYIEFS